MIREKDQRIVRLILEKIDRLMFICDKYSLQEVEEDFMCFDSLSYEFEKMYEDFTRLSKEFVAQNSFLPIENMRAIRNRVAHDYASVIVEVLYDTVKNDFPSFKEQLLKLIES